MKLFTFIICMMALNNLAMAKGYGWRGPKDMATGCGNAIVDKLAADKYVSQYLRPEQEISLDWYDDEKTLVSFTSNFGDDVRDGYVTGEIEVSVKSDGYCVVSEVKNYDIGD